MFSEIFSSSDDFVDYENAVCSFDSPEFIKLLEFCNEFPQEIDKPDLSNGRDTGNNEIYRYQKHTCNRHKPEYQKDAVNKVFKCSFSFCGTVII